MPQGLFTLSPLDGRYAAQVVDIAAIGSEAGLIGYRLRVELHWLLALAHEPQLGEIPSPTAAQSEWLLRLESKCDYAQVKQLEQRTNHDVKALEYWIKDQLAQHSFWKGYTEFVHFACTSEDINNLAYALMARDLRAALVKRLNSCSDSLARLSADNAETPMLSLTHGQPATPTTLGKEFANIHARLARQRNMLDQQHILGKLNGAVGNFNAHHQAYPEIKWYELCQNVVEGLGITYNPMTTQIEPHDWMAEYCHVLMRINTIILDASRDLWGYISRGLFTQVIAEGEVGSSTMPHKVNPIDFENAEGNLGLANALLGHCANKLPVSRWQRDLSDSTVLRNFASAVGYCAIAYQAFARGLGKIQPNPDQLIAELAANPEVLAEAIQTVMRRYAIPEPYEKLKALTRGKRLDSQAIAQFIDQHLSSLPDRARQALAALQPQHYTGRATELVRQHLAVHHQHSD